MLLQTVHNASSLLSLRAELRPTHINTLKEIRLCGVRQLTLLFTKFPMFEFDRFKVCVMYVYVYVCVCVVHAYVYFVLVECVCFSNLSL